MSLMTHLPRQGAAPFATRFKVVVGGAVGALVLFAASAGILGLKVPDWAQLTVAAFGALTGFIILNRR